MTQKVITGQKKIESRWYKTRHSPWGGIVKDDTIYFKNSGELITVRAAVEKVVYYSDLEPAQIKLILEEHGNDIGIDSDDLNNFYNLCKNKKYCILTFLNNPEAVKPFSINKTGFGMMAAWLTVDDIDKIKT